MEVEKITKKEYLSKLLLYHKENPSPKIEINKCGKSIVLKRTFIEEYFIEDIDTA